MALNLPLLFTCAAGTVSISESDSAFAAFAFFGGASSESDCAFTTFLAGAFFITGAAFGGFSSSLSSLDGPATSSLGFGFGLDSTAFFFVAVFDGLNSSSESSEP